MANLDLCTDRIRRIVTRHPHRFPDSKLSQTGSVSAQCWIDSQTLSASKSSWTWPLPLWSCCIDTRPDGTEWQYKSIQSIGRYNQSVDTINRSIQSIGQYNQTGIHHGSMSTNMNLISGKKIILEEFPGFSASRNLIYSIVINFDGQLILFKVSGNNNNNNTVSFHKYSSSICLPWNSWDICIPEFLDIQYPWLTSQPSKKTFPASNHDSSTNYAIIMVIDLSAGKTREHTVTPALLLQPVPLHTCMQRC